MIKILFRIFIGLLSGLAIYLGYYWKKLHIEYINVYQSYNQYALSIIGERNILQDPYGYADLFLNELHTILNINSTHWKLELNTTKYIIESIPLVNDFKEHYIPLQRCNAFIYSSLSIDEIFNYMTSPDGFLLLDPVSDETSLKDPPVLAYDWNRGIYIIYIIYL